LEEYSDAGYMILVGRPSGLGLEDSVEAKD
jgi:hypothetical protein